jgi:hypothetical protein
MVRHPSTGQNLLMAGADLLDAPTGTAVAQWSESGQGILGAKEGKGMWVWSAVVLAVLSSRMSAGGCSLAGRRDNVPCLRITALFIHYWRARKKKALKKDNGDAAAHQNMKVTFV